MTEMPDKFPDPVEERAFQVQSLRTLREIEKALRELSAPGAVSGEVHGHSEASGRVEAYPSTAAATGTARNATVRVEAVRVVVGIPTPIVNGGITAADMDKLLPPSSRTRIAEILRRDKLSEVAAGTFIVLGGVVTLKDITEMVIALVGWLNRHV